ncbi:MAG: glycosyltransferase [Janthinobacterium lividum]
MTIDLLHIPRHSHPRQAVDPAPSLFRSFWMGGYEGADHVNSQGEPLHMRRDNGHERNAEADYAALARFGIRTIRESVGWRVSTDGRGRLDLGAVVRMAHLAERHGLQVIWTLHHYGHPPGVDLFHPALTTQFADFCSAAARALKDIGDRAPVFQPMNEISFLSWAAATTDLIHPYRAGTQVQGYELKCRLVAATLAGCDAIWAEAPDARIVHTDPAIHVAPASPDPMTVDAAAALTAEQFQAWDMLAGRTEPGLGGSLRYLDVIGINYYHSSQWLHPGNAALPWHLGDPRRRPLHEVLADIWRRYGRPLFVAETGHVGDGRAQWMEDIAQAVLRCQVDAIPLEGVCLYPLVDRCDWEEPTRFHHSALWDVRGSAATAATDGFAPPDRTLHLPFADCLLRWQRLVPAPNVATAVQVLAHPPSPFDTGSRSLDPAGIPMTTLIVFSHLRWNFVYQRPQQLLSRLARRFQVVFVEEPVPNAERAVLERLQPCSGVEVLRPHVTGGAPGFHDDHIPVVQALLAGYLKSHALNDYWLWFYTPMAVPLASGLTPGGIVYDCMDELAVFQHAPRQLLQRENVLFRLADLVFTGGQSLYESKRDRHADVHCLPSSVDAAHFSRDPGGTGHGVEPEVQARIPGPRIGYFGVIDERVDLALIRRLATDRPDWQLVMVGPVVKIDPGALPRAANIHWLGQQDYADLPAFIAGWDVCLLPFALNEATRFISPTKTLEYMAAGKPIVGTPIRDVVAPYGHVVRIADTPEAFVRACEEALAQSAEAGAQEQRLRDAVLARTSWNKTATQMADLIDARETTRLAAVATPAGASGAYGPAGLPPVTPAAALG